MMTPSGTVRGSQTISDGGGIRNTGGIVTVTHSTWVGNSANRGGAIANSSLATLIARGCTIAGNAAGFAGGGLYADTVSFQRIENSIFWDNVIAEPGTDPEQSEIAELRPEVARKLVTLVDLRRARRDAVGGKRRDRFTQHVDVFAETEIEVKHA